MVQLLKSYCLPFLLYASEAVRPSCSNVHSLENCINRAIFRIFHVGGKEYIDSIRQFVGLPCLSILMERRKQKFVDRLITNNQCSKLFLINVDYRDFIALKNFFFNFSLLYSTVNIFLCYSAVYVSLLLCCINAK